MVKKKIYQINLPLCNESPYHGKRCIVVGEHRNLMKDGSVCIMPLVKVLDAIRGGFKTIAVDEENLEEVN